MAKHKGSTDAGERAPGFLSGWKWLALTGFVLVLFYWTPVLGPDTSIQWNAADLFHPLQSVFSEVVKSGHLPHWTNYLAAGFPLLSDPQTGGFYPLNWPFFLAGVTPGAIQGEIALHALIAICGAFLLIRRLTDHAPAALAGAFSYGLGGYFASHSSQVGMFQCAALLPWVLYCYERAGDGSRLAWLARAALVAGCGFLTGSLSSAVVVLVALVLFAVWRRLDAPGLVLIAAASIISAAVVLVPAWMLFSEAKPENLFQAMSVKALGSLVWPNALGVFTGQYSAGIDLTKGYLYSGILIVPLVGFALRNTRLRLPAALLVGVPLAASLFHSADYWFAAALGLSILMAFGVIEAEGHFRQPLLGLLVLLVFTADLCAVNSWYNPLAYARISYKEYFGNGREALHRMSTSIPPGYRLELAAGQTIFGSLNAAMLEHVEITGGFNPLNLAAWRDYRRAAGANLRLADGMSAALKVEAGQEKIEGNGSVLPRAYFVQQVVSVSSLDDSRARLTSLDPAHQALVQTPFPAVQPDPQAHVASVKVVEQGASVRYSAASPSLLKLTNTYYPGWTATVDGQSVQVLRVDHALMGAVVPAGDHEIVFEYRTPRFEAGAVASGIVALGLLLLALRREKS